MRRGIARLKKVQSPSALGGEFAEQFLATLGPIRTLARGDDFLQQGDHLWSRGWGSPQPFGQFQDGFLRFAAHDEIRIGQRGLGQAEGNFMRKICSFSITLGDWSTFST